MNNSRGLGKIRTSLSLRLVCLNDILHRLGQVFLSYQKAKQCHLDGTGGESKDSTEAGNKNIIRSFIGDIIAVIFDHKNPLKLGFELHINVAIGL